MARVNNDNQPGRRCRFQSAYCTSAWWPADRSCRFIETPGKLAVLSESTSCFSQNRLLAWRWRWSKLLKLRAVSGEIFCHNTENVVCEQRRTSSSRHKERQAAYWSHESEDGGSILLSVYPAFAALTSSRCRTRTERKAEETKERTRFNEGEYGNS